jgi:hypothetical protein
LSAPPGVIKISNVVLGRGLMAGAMLGLLAACTALTPVGSLAPDEPATRRPCAFVDAELVGTVLHVADLDVASEPAVPESLCRFRDPRTGQQVAMLSIPRMAAVGADAIIAEIANTYRPDAAATDVKIGPTGTTGTAYEYDHREAGPTTSLAFGVAPYFFIVHVAGEVGGVAASIAIAEAVVANATP